MTSDADNPIQAQLRRRQAARTRERPAADSLEPPGPLWRQVRACAPPAYATTPAPTLEQARAHIRAEIDAYLALESPPHMLLVRAVPGVGKTHAGVETAEACADRGWRVAYAGPRHDFFADVTTIARHPKRWYEWQPRTEGDEDKGVRRTCDWVPEISGWLNKGYQGIDFCARVCGWDYVNNRCLWHRQKNREEPIIFIQHQHVASGHPLEFRVLIGDENPMQAFLWQWDIPAKQVVPHGMDYAEPLTEILLKLSGLCSGGELTSGLALMDALGGAQLVLEACELYQLPASALAFADIHSVGEAERADYFHLPQLVPLLTREARAAIEDRLYPPRVIAGKGDLSLLLRRWPDTKLPQHVIWLDATGNQHIYEELFGRPVKVVDAAPALQGHITVVTDRANGKGDFKADQAAQVIRKVAADRGYQRPAVVTFESAEAALAGEWDSAHFYGARGTNRLEAADALFVVGAPMPNHEVLLSMAAQIYFKRMVAFGRSWDVRYVPYRYVAPDGRGREYPAGGFWRDADLEALLWQYREAELIQAVHRARPVLRPVPIYLLSNVPIPELPVTRLATMAELLGTIKPVEIRSMYDWQRLQEFVAGRESVTAAEIAAALQVSENTAIKYRDLLAKQPGWELVARKTNTGAGRSTKAATRRGISLSSKPRVF